MTVIVSPFTIPFDTTYFVRVILTVADLITKLMKERRIPAMIGKY